MTPILEAIYETADKSSTVGLMGITDEVFQKLNTSKHAVEVPSELGSGRIAFLEALHQLHCLVSTLYKDTGSFP